ncbi:hypothetical protein Hypma_014291 [Hypsizygus marmoreus]|uniref:Uncharacterized protein n=1 Tax=Hypsizygus marmoreus TaxID=39966 RepID=A0A369JC99_HYPMA|nr:hypothetical protein Hypma_014291 [Hypsizygus marmoreus]
MFFSKVFVALTAVAVAAASPVAKRAVYCSLVLTPTVAVSSSNLTAEFNYTLGRSLAIAVPSGMIHNGGSTYTDNDDGTYNVATDLSAEGASDGEVTAIITGWTAFPVRKVLEERDLSKVYKEQLELALETPTNEHHSSEVSSSSEMFFSKVFVALAAIVVVAASPVKRAAICSYILTPTTAVSGDLTTDFNFALGRALVNDLPDGSLVYAPGTTYTDNGDGTYSVESAFSSESVTDEEIAAIITGWAGETLPGFTTDWHVDTVTCA